MRRKDLSADSLDLEATLSELESSGLSTAAFARERGIAAWKLYGELRRRRKRRLAEHGTGRTAAGPGMPFVAVQLVPQTSPEAAFEVELCGGRVLRVPPAFDESSLLRLVRALESC